MPETPITDNSEERSMFCVIYEGPYEAGTLVRAPQPMTEQKWTALILAAYADYAQADDNDLDSFPYWLAERLGWKVEPAASVTFN